MRKLVAVEALAGQGVDHLLDLGGDDVAAGEFGVVENLAEKPFGEQVLHEHLIDGGPADVRVQGGLAKSEEVVEGGLEFLVVLVGRGQDIPARLPASSGTRSLNSSTAWSKSSISGSV